MFSVVVAAEPAAGPGFWRRNRDELVLEAIGGLVLALLVSFAISWIDQSREEERSARDEALSNSLFVRQTVTSERDLLRFSSLYLAEADLPGADLTAADLTGAILADVRWTDSFYLDGAPPVGADLDGLPAEALAESDADADDD